MIVLRVIFVGSGVFVFVPSFVNFDVFFLNLSVLWCAFIARGLICVDAVLVGVRKSMICVKL